MTGIIQQPLVDISFQEQSRSFELQKQIIIHKKL